GPCGVDEVEGYRGDSALNHPDDRMVKPHGDQSDFERKGPGNRHLHRAYERRHEEREPSGDEGGRVRVPDGGIQSLVTVETHKAPYHSHVDDVCTHYRDAPVPKEDSL